MGFNVQTSLQRKFWWAISFWIPTPCCNLTLIFEVKLCLLCVKTELYAHYNLLMVLPLWTLFYLLPCGTTWYWVLEEKSGTDFPSKRLIKMHCIIGKMIHTFYILLSCMSCIWILSWCLWTHFYMLTLWYFGGWKGTVWRSCWKGFLNKLIATISFSTPVII